MGSPVEGEDGGAVNRRETFSGGRVELDGRVFVGCTFHGIRLAYHGRGIVVLWQCSWPDPTSLNFELGGEARKLIWDLGVAHRFGESAQAESVARYIEGQALTLPRAASHFSDSPYLIPSLREISAAIPRLMEQVLRFIRGEPQSAIHEPVRLICGDPACGQVSVVPSMLPPGATHSGSVGNAMTCPGCRRLARIENHWTDSEGRVFRELADRVLRDSGLPRSAIERLEALVRDVGDKSPAQAAGDIAAIDERMAPIAEQISRSSDRRQFIARLAILAAIAGAILLGGTTFNESARAGDGGEALSSRTVKLQQPTVRARTPTLDETVSALGQQLEAACTGMLDDASVTTVDLREMLEACRLEARDRQRLAAERADSSAGYARQFWVALRSPETLASAALEGVIDAAAALLFASIGARLVHRDPS